MARPKGVKEKKKRKRVYKNSTILGPKKLKVTYKNDLTPGEMLVWNSYANKEKKVGGPKLFEAPEQMLLAVQKFFIWCEEHPLPPLNIKKYADGRMKYVGQWKRRPWTLINFCHYCGVTHGWWRNFRRSVYARQQDSSAFYAVIEFVEEACKGQQLDGAMIGDYNMQLTVMLNRIREDEPEEKEGKTSIPNIEVYNIAPPFASDEDGVDAVRQLNPKKK